MTTTTDLDRALPLVDDAAEIARTAETYAAAVHEIEQRVNAGRITAAERADLGGDLLALAEVLMNYALRVNA